MAHLETKPKPEVMPELILSEKAEYPALNSEHSDRVFQRLRTLWDNRSALARAALFGGVFGLLLAFLVATRE